MTVSEYTVLVALVLHALALPLWLKKLVRLSIPRGLWALGLLSVLTSGGLRALEATGSDQSVLHALGALVMGTIFLCAAAHVHAALRRQAKEKAYYAHLQAAFNTLLTEMQDHGQLAENLAVLLHELHEKIAHYEALAEEHGLPLYGKRNGGA